MDYKFEKDTSNATLNPLYIQSNNKIEEKEKKIESKYHQYWWKVSLLFRALFFLILPICLIWLIDIKGNITLYAYTWIYYVIVVQATALRSIINENNRILKIMCSFVFLSIFISICIELVPDNVVKTDDSYTHITDYKECQIYTRKELPICDLYFTDNDVDFVLATPTKTADGKSLSRESIIKSLALMDSYKDFVMGQIKCSIFLGLMCQSILSLCDASCQQTKISSNLCNENYNPQCLDARTIKDMDIALTSITFLPDANDNTIMSELVQATLTDWRNGTEIQTQADMCENKRLFVNTSQNNATSFDCAKKEFIPGSNIITSGEILIFQIVFSCFSVVIFTWLSTYRSAYGKDRQLYTLWEIVEIIGCIIFMLVLFTSLIFNLVELLNSNDLIATFVYHMFGILSAGIVFLSINIAFTLIGKKPMHTNTEERNIFKRYHTLFEALTNVRDGKYYFQYIIMFEIFEIGLQFITFDAMIRHNDVEYVFLASLIISLNLIFTPIGFLAIVYNENLGRKVTYISDTVLETAYLFLNLYFTKTKDLINFGILLSLIIPLFALIAKVSNFVEYTGTYEINQARRQSWIERNLKFAGRQNENESTSRTKKRSKKHIYVYIAISSLMISAGSILFIYIVVSIAHVTNLCQDKLGKAIWDGAFPRYVFFDGPFATPSCHFETIQEIIADKKNIEIIAPAIGELKNLRQMKLPNNNVKELPIEILKLTKAKFDLSNNPIWKKFYWERKDLKEFPWILEQFVELTTLSLRNNNITSVPSFINKLGALSELDMSSNFIHSKGLSTSLTQLNMLVKLNITNNPVAKSLTWNGVENNIIGMRLLNMMYSELETLDVSYGYFTTDDIERILRYPRLIALNATFNQMNTLKPTAYGIHLKMLDISNNPIIDLDERFFKNFSSLWNRGGYIGMANFQDSTFMWNGADNYSVEFLESYLRSNDILHFSFKYGDFAPSFCSFRNPNTISTILVTHIQKEELDLSCLDTFHGVSAMDLGSNEIGTYLNGCEKLGNVVLNMPKLATLHLWNNDLSLCSKDLFHNIGKLSMYIEYLDIGRNNIDGQTCEYVASTLVNLTKLKVVGMHHNKYVSDKCCKRLAHAFEKLHSLEFLYLEHNQITDDGVASIISSLTELQHLEKVRFSSNNITDIGVKYLAHALPNMSSSLRSMTFYDNNITGAGEAYMKRAWENAGKDPRLFNRNAHS